tara:strand:+ start:971 stop:1216 length:246 start_codon:yes stop_codon:yes gene_type:complete
MLDIIIEKISKITLREDLNLFDKDEDILQSGLIDSFGYVQLLTALEDEFSIMIGEEEQFDNRLRTINGILKFCEEKLKNKK